MKTIFLLLVVLCVFPVLIVVLGIALMKWAIDETISNDEGVQD